MSQTAPQTVPTCFDSLWEAIESVEGAELWLTYLHNSGLDIVSRDPEYAGIVFVAKDQALVPCNVSAVFGAETWPQADNCGQLVREKTLLLSTETGQSLLQFQWLPGLDPSDIDYGRGYRTLLANASAAAGVDAPEDGLAIQFIDNRTVALLDDALPQRGDIDAESTASIIEEKTLCDPGKGHVYVLDSVLFSRSSPVVSPTVLPPLDGYCDTSIYPILIENENIALTAELAIGAYVTPMLLPMTDPSVNITLFAPAFDGDLSLQSGGFVPVGTEDLQGQVALYLLLGVLRGGYCPEDFGPNGLLVNSLGGEFAGKNLTMMVKQSTEDPSQIELNLLFGNSGALKYTAQFLGKACYATLYQVNSLITPWADNTDPTYVDGVPFQYLSSLPHVPQNTLFNVTEECTGLLGPMGDAVSNGSGQVIPVLPANSSPDSSNTTSSTPDASSTTEGSTAGATSTSLSSGAIAGIAIGAVAGIGILLLIFFWAKRRRSAQKTVEGASGQLSPKGSGSHETPDSVLFAGKSQSVTSGDSGTLAFTDDDLLLKDSEVTIDVDSESGEPILLGKGRFGKVFRGTLLASEQVAVKCIGEEPIDQLSDSGSDARTNSRDSGGSSEFGGLSFANMSYDQVMKEIRLLKSCHSQHIVSFIGAMFRRHEVRLVTELMPSGDLWNALGRGSAPRTVTWYDSGIFIALDVAAGLNYLHEKKRVIHLDLKSSNILLRESKRDPHCPGSRYVGSYLAKVSDVGLSKILPASHEYLTSMEAGGTWNWCAPEVILNAKCTPSADMYSYGVVLWEICTGEIPVRGRMRDLRVPEECPQRIADLIHQCLSRGPAPGWKSGSGSIFSTPKRPTAGHCISVLQTELCGSGGS